MMKKLKVIGFFILILFSSIGVFQSYQHFFGKKETVSVIASKEDNKIKQKKIIEKDLVIRTLRKQSKLVGLKGEIQKEISFEETINPIKMNEKEWKIIQKAKNEINKQKTRTYEVNANAVYQTGFDLSLLSQEDITVDEYKGIITIKTPPVVLVSFEMPYYKIQYSKEDGLLVSPFTEEEEKSMIKETEEKIKQEVMKNKQIQNVTIEKTQKSIEEFLKMFLPEAKEIHFVSQ